MTLAEHCRKLIVKHGSARKAAEAIGLNHSYLWRLAKGEKSEPTPDVLEKLGLERVVSYRKAKQ